jgi:hypothetical protein
MKPSIVLPRRTNLFSAFAVDPYYVSFDFTSRQCARSFLPSITLLLLPPKITLAAILTLVNPRRASYQTSRICHLYSKNYNALIE